MKQFLFAALIMSTCALFTSCDKDIYTEPEIAQTQPDLDINLRKAQASGINICPGSSSVSVLIYGCSSGSTIFYTVEDSSGNTADSGHFVLVGNSFNTNTGLNECTDYEIEVRIMGCGTFTRQFTTGSSSSSCGSPACEF